ncbi:MAG: hypothetical protein IBX70_06070 [Clostridia bacterium]|nr:hypothetical protein [Clostridia bacterium]
MSSNFYSYSLMVFLCSMVIFSDSRRRILKKEDIRYRIKEEKKHKHLFYALGLLVPVVILVSGMFYEKSILIKILIFIMSVEMGIIWTIIQLGDTLITKDSLGKAWYTRISTIEYFDVLRAKGRPYLVFRKAKSRRQEMVWLSECDVKPVLEHLNALNIAIKKT